MDGAVRFETIYKEYWDKIFRLCLGYVNDQELARDMAQEVFVIVWQQLHTFQQKSSISTWIYRIAVNRCLRQIEKEKRVTKVEFPILVNEVEEQDLDAPVKLLYQFVSELPELDRVIISMELEEVKQSEIARITGISDGNVRTRIHRIKQLLNKKFKEHGY